MGGGPAPGNLTRRFPRLGSPPRLAALASPIVLAVGVCGAGAAFLEQQPTLVLVNASTYTGEWMRSPLPPVIWLRQAGYASSSPVGRWPQGPTCKAWLRT